MSSSLLSPNICDSYRCNLVIVNIVKEVICVSVDSVERAERFLRRGEPDPTAERGEARPTREPRLHLPRHGRDL